MPACRVLSVLSSAAVAAVCAFISMFHVNACLLLATKQSSISSKNSGMTGREQWQPAVGTTSCAGGWSGERGLWRWQAIHRAGLAAVKPPSARASCKSDLDCSCCQHSKLHNN